jgi:hypothetical protein
MRFLNRQLFFLCVLLAPAASASAQDAIDLDDGALLDRVKKEIDALVQASDTARPKKEALEEIGVSISEARRAVDAPLPADPGVMDHRFLRRHSRSIAEPWTADNHGD